MVQLPPGGSAAHNPELDWNQVRETILMLGVAVAQVQDALVEGNHSFSTLADSFSHTYLRINEIKAAIHPLRHLVPQDLDLESKVAELGEQNTKAVMAFQFYDRLSQRLEHVCTAISNLTTLVSDEEAIYQPEAWISLQKTIRAQYTMEQEKLVFDAILSGKSIHEALAQAGKINLNPEKKEHSAQDGGIELF